MVTGAASDERDYAWQGQLELPPESVSSFSLSPFLSPPVSPPTWPPHWTWRRRKSEYRAIFRLSSFSLISSFSTHSEIQRRVFSAAASVRFFLFVSLFPLKQHAAGDVMLL